ncbi:MAG: glycerate kinase [Chthoniobacterales bacterium]
MQILVAPDKFKGSLGAAAVAEAIAAGLLEVLPAAEVVRLPVADGGEGTAEVICAAAGGRWHSCAAQAANGLGVSVRFVLIDGGEVAVVEASEANGLWRIPEDERDPVSATSFGVGEMMLAVAKQGARRAIIGLGGSATNDGGFGMARALGYRFLYRDGRELSGPVSDLLQLAAIKKPRDRILPSIVVAADVRAPLLGERGATRVFGTQKGATAEQLDLLEAALTKFADIVASEFGQDFRDVAGAGAAGGLGFGLLNFARAEMRAGFEVVSELVGLEEAIRAADVVVTGEGRMDAQTLEGKAPAGVAQLARKFGKRCYAVVGQLEEAPGVRELFDGIVTLPPGLTNSEQAVRAAAQEFALQIRRESEPPA